MAIIWQQTLHGTRYEVRSAGSSIRLYNNGHLNSQYSARHFFTGNVWDLLILPALLTKTELARVLVLGVGGGTAIHQLDQIYGPAAMLGIELDPVHIRIARRFFDLDLPNLSIHRADAMQWVRNYRGPRFDLIIDDLFLESDGQPCRSIEAGTAWLRQLSRLLSRKGLLVQNHISSAELARSAALQDSRIRSRFKSALRLTLPVYENAVGAFYREQVELATGPKAVRHLLRQRFGLADNRLRFRARRLF
ncbi:MAG: methyltransferase domain-containing protein [Pseudomonadales bacterium]|nr:methyltransferase domain-containing protein [Pseudomonadales bacterium]MDP7358833.1 methyltransferase domain-containing protein [Pseudomonadales bacterium]MDP7594387.1 methyltransferase domain-containing protein [Pseudomonadales bacterium]HJN49058.1 methyltransferase domain-containing protein [Pseudomonadales bacterium]